MTDRGNAAGLAADGEWLEAAYRAADLEDDPVRASTYALIAIAEALEGFIHRETGLLGVVNYPESR